MNYRKILLGVIIMISLGTALATPILQQQFVQGVTGDNDIRTKAPPAITGDNVYVAWWTNKTGNDDHLPTMDNRLVIRLT